ncbi:hypothetical protein PV721_29840 [Streptomyces sp. MB09-01]|uniref:hypothetical protein n=1 Tax=Streptomyces sp. MB09-01 TaxID=3028666 RepID=UPI0029AF8ED4|nr:hypothetical protein [Streptomyces sp. MB09-01]MDX3538475.1 hypothetical protein [Streptomyces sp. MB09-01]
MTRATMGPPTPIAPASAFFRACLYEWRHLTALRSTWVLLGVVALLSLLTGLNVLLDAEGQNTANPLIAADSITWAPLSTQVPALCFFMLAIGTGPVSTDLVTGAARTTWLAVNGPRTAYTAKCTVGFSVACAVAATSVLLGALSYAAALALIGAPQPAWLSVLLPAVRFVAWMGCWALLCMAVISLLRSRILPILILVLWPLIVERLIGALLGRLPCLDGIGNWLPFAAGRAMLTDASAYSGEDRSFVKMLIGSHLSPSEATVVFFLYTTVIATAGLWAYCRRDLKTI